LSDGASELQASDTRSLSVLKDRAAKEDEHEIGLVDVHCTRYFNDRRLLLIIREKRAALILSVEDKSLSDFTGFTDQLARLSSSATLPEPQT
jgi:hypothetical protein